MSRKFLVFSIVVSCLILFVSLVYYLYTGYRLRVENQSVQELITKLESPVVERWNAGDSFQHSTLEHTNAEPTESEAYEDLFEQTGLEEMEETEIAALLDAFDEIEASGEWEEDTTDGLLSRGEREELFKTLKPIMNRREVIWREQKIVTGEYSGLLNRLYERLDEYTDDISPEESARLDAEGKRNWRRMDELIPLMDDLTEQDNQTQEEIAHKVSEYGLTFTEFYERYIDEYNSWRAGL